MGEDGAPIQSRCRDPVELDEEWKAKMEKARIEEEKNKMSWSFLRSQRNQEVCDDQ